MPRGDRRETIKSPSERILLNQGGKGESNPAGRVSIMGRKKIEDRVQYNGDGIGQKLSGDVYNHAPIYNSRVSRESDRKRRRPEYRGRECREGAKRGKSGE
jgi:hypothetical protein